LQSSAKHGNPWFFRHAVLLRTPHRTDLSPLREWVCPGNGTRRAPGRLVEGWASRSRNLAHVSASSTQTRLTRALARAGFLILVKESIYAMTISSVIPSFA
jgi:hypothetical protein